MLSGRRPSVEHKSRSAPSDISISLERPGRASGGSSLKNTDVAKVFQRMRSKIGLAGDYTAAEPLPVPDPEATK